MFSPTEQGIRLLVFYKTSSRTFIPFSSVYKIIIKDWYKAEWTFKLIVGIKYLISSLFL